MSKHLTLSRAAIRTSVQLFEVESVEQIMSALLAACILVIFLLFKWFTKNKDFFRDKPIPSMPFRSLRYNTVSLLLRATDIGTFCEQMYNKFADAK